MRCGSVGRGRNKGYEEVSCRWCSLEEESLQRIWVYREFKKQVKAELIEKVEATVQETVEKKKG